MTKTSSGSDGVFYASMTAKVYEPEKRNKDGLRWIRHRFPIKGGISAKQVTEREITKPNALLQRLLTRRGANT